MRAGNGARARSKTTRFAPAPTGYLHLGHVASALWVWGVARAVGARILLRIEDHDRVRCRPEFEAALLDDLDWLGFVADAPPVRQSERGPLYAHALARLERAGQVYACRCTRREIAAGSAEGAPELHYPGTCRGLGVDPDSTPIRRVRFDREAIEFDDVVAGRRSQIPAEQCGDLLAVDRDGNWTYQFAVVVDDLEQGVDLVVRGADLLESTGRQIQLASLLVRAVPPRFLHHPLIFRDDGTKLSKSNRDAGVRELRAGGRTAGEVRGAAAAAVGLVTAPRQVVLDELASLPLIANAARKIAEADAASRG